LIVESILVDIVLESNKLLSDIVFIDNYLLLNSLCLLLTGIDFIIIGRSLLMGRIVYSRGIIYYTIKRYDVLNS